MDARSPLHYLGGALQQVAFVVKDLTAGMGFSRTMGVARVYVIEDFGLHARDKMFRGRPAEQNFKLALAYSGDTQIELIQHLCGDTCYKEHLERRGEGLTDLGFSSMIPRISGRAGFARRRRLFGSDAAGGSAPRATPYFDTEAGDRLDNGESSTSISAAGYFMAKIKKWRIFIRFESTKC